MKKSSLIAIVALLMFGVSYMLPAFEDFTGFRCEEMCRGALLNEPLKSPYYSAFTLTNLAFLVVAVISFTRAGYSVVNRIFATLTLVHVLSWFALNVYTFMSGSEKKFEIRIGYYLWALAYGFLLWALVEKKNEPTQSPEPTA